MHSSQDGDSLVSNFLNGGIINEILMLYTAANDEVGLGLGLIDIAMDRKKTIQQHMSKPD